MCVWGRERERERGRGGGGTDDCLKKKKKKIKGIVQVSVSVVSRTVYLHDRKWCMTTTWCDIWMHVKPWEMPQPSAQIRQALWQQTAWLWCRATLVVCYLSYIWLVQWCVIVWSGQCWTKQMLQLVRWLANQKCRGTVCVRKTEVRERERNSDVCLKFQLERVGKCCLSPRKWIDWKGSKNWMGKKWGLRRDIKEC